MKNTLWITGGSRGIGKATTVEFLNKGWNVVVITRNTQPLDSLKSEFGDQLTLVAGDLMNLEEIQLPNLPVHILIHNAGGLINKPMQEISMSDLQYCYGINVFAPYILTQKLLPQFESNAHIIGISSVGGVQGSVKFPGLSAYSSSKGAEITLMECFHAEFESKTNWSFNTLALGAVQTEMLNEAFPGFKAPLSPSELSPFIYSFATTAGGVMKGKIVQVSMSTP
jgi:NAD(P)-dependent dehydrogenase (short-subunit alcohol dehydrogenase family)